MTNLIELININKVINEQIILKDINLKIKKNEFVTLLGPSGCGKTTILKIIGGFYDFNSGDILFDNKSIANLSPHKRLINTVFQKYALFPHLNVFENIAFGLRIKDLNYNIKKEIKKIKKQQKKDIKKIKNDFFNNLKSIFPLFKNSLFFLLKNFKNTQFNNLRKEWKNNYKNILFKYQEKIKLLNNKILSKKQKEEFIRSKVLHYLNLVGLKGLENREINQLSGGQQQRVAIARALINEPKVLLLDEPLAALDLKLRQEMQYELKEIQRNSGITFIFVTHNQEEALTMSDKIVVINKGEIQQIGTPEDIYNEPANKFIAKFIGESNLISGIFKEDYLVFFDNQEFHCIDYGFKKNQKVDILIRPEDIDIVSIEDGLLKGVINSILFKGVYWEVIIKTKQRDYIIHTTDFIKINTEVGIFFKPEDLHVMEIW
ncbi:ABC transporter ATP-binding protein [Candidatus Phytoplasma sacchari]|uniref:ABC transporter ATP-binding protein n=1 Tax=Candidatus Phytoplasma sacchari TaxID=2609813 RepID=A0ABY7M124_9MOLU|nr:ABC transporter ATP-binding protein [Candidatus Phytoplasma sacchari]